MTKQISLHLPDDLHAKVKEAADQDRRSLHSEMLYALEEWLAERDAAPEGRVAE